MKLKKVLLSMICINLSFSVLMAGKKSDEKAEKEFNEFSEFLKKKSNEIGEKCDFDGSKMNLEGQYENWISKTLEVIKFLSFDNYAKNIKEIDLKSKILLSFYLVSNHLQNILEELNKESILNDYSDEFPKLNKIAQSNESQTVFFRTISNKFIENSEIKKNCDFFIKISNRFIEILKQNNVIDKNAEYGVINISNFISAENIIKKAFLSSITFEHFINSLSKNEFNQNEIILMTFFSRESNFFIGTSIKLSGFHSKIMMFSKELFGYTLKGEEFVENQGFVIMKNIGRNVTNQIVSDNKNEKNSGVSYAFYYYSGAKSENPFSYEPLYVDPYGDDYIAKELFKDMPENKTAEVLLEIPETKEDWLILDYILLSDIENKNKEIKFEFIEDDIKSIENNNILSIESSDLNNLENQVSNLDTKSIQKIADNIKEEIIKEKETSLTAKINDVSEKIKNIEKDKKGKKGKKEGTFNRSKRNKNNGKKSKGKCDSKNEEDIILLKKKKELLEKEKKGLRSNFSEFISKKRIKFKNISSFINKILKKEKNVIISRKGSHINIHGKGYASVVTLVQKHGRDAVYMPKEVMSLACDIMKMAFFFAEKKK